VLTGRVKQIIGDMAEAGGCQLSDTDWEILATPTSVVEAGGLTEAQTSRLDEVSARLGRGFFHLGAHGYEYVDSDQIKRKFGRTLRENYPEANETFLAFATSYWTFKLWVQELVASDDDVPISVDMLPAAEQLVASVFFPTPGPAKIDPSQREQTQREILAEYEVPIDVEAFIAGNPILIRDRQRSSSGCAGSVIGLAAIGVGSLSRFFR